MSINDQYHLMLIIEHNFNLNEMYELLSYHPHNIKNVMSMIMFRTIIHKFFENLFKFQIIYKGGCTNVFIFKKIYLG